MTTFGVVQDVQTISDPEHVSPIREVASSSVLSRSRGADGEQIQGLVQQLFFRQNPALVRHVGFTSIEKETGIAPLCLEVARALSESGLHDVALIDARLQSAPLHEELQLPAGNHGDASWLIAPRLWLAPRQSWLDADPQRMWDSSLVRLRSTTMEFDFSILCFDPASWLTARISQACHGLVMVLTANKTRRLVAAQMQEQLHRARVPLLGTVLAERRFAVPGGLYHRL